MARIFIFLFTFMALQLHAEPNKLNITSWGGAYQDVQREAFFKPFEEDSGYKINEHEYGGGLSEIATMLKKGQISWDIVDIEAADLVNGCNKGYFEPIRWQSIGSKANFIKGASHRCGVGSVIWSMILAFRLDDFKGEKQRFTPYSWKDFWDLDKIPGKRGMQKQARFNMEIALLADGVEKDKIYSVLRTNRGRERAFKKLEQLLPYIEWWEHADQPTQWLITKNVALATAYNGRVADVSKKGHHMGIMWRDNIFTIDYWAIVKGSPNKDTAHRFIKFASDPMRQVKIVSNLLYAPTVKRAMYRLPAKIKQVLPKVEDRSVLGMAQSHDFWAFFGEKIEKEFQEWFKKMNAPKV
jgi:putative spermidine/putrescine transport system substrate-binding protein